MLKLCWFVCCSSIYLLLPMMRGNRIMSQWQFKVWIISWKRWSSDSPDGQNDGHFQVRVYLPREVEVKNLRLYKSNYRSEKLDSCWYSHTSGAWVLGVFQNRKLLNPNREDSLGSFSGWVLLDIYAAVEGSCFDEGEYLLLEMTTSEGVLTKLFQVGGDVR